MENDEEISDYERLRLRNIEVLKSKLYENLGDIQTLKHQIISGTSSKPPPPKKTKVAPPKIFKLPKGSNFKKSYNIK